MAGVVGTCAVIGCCIPQQSVIVERIRGVTDVVVLGICNGVSRRSNRTISVNFCVTTGASAMYLLVVYSCEPLMASLLVAEIAPLATLVITLAVLSFP